jgi:small-conductance mechanosensitive channel
MMATIDDVLRVMDRVYLSNTVALWLYAGAAFGLTVLVFTVLRRLLERWATRWHEGWRGTWGVLLLQNTHRYVRVIIGMYLAENILVLPAAVDRVFHAIVVIGIAYQVASWTVAALRQQVGRAPISVLLFVGQVIIWSVAALFALDNLGVNITALIAGLGVGGIAIALSVQTILGDLFSSLSIAFDKPFQIGDMLRIDDIEGRVEHVSIRSTRLRSVTGEQVVLSNADMLKSRVRNLGRMPERRVLFRLLVAYDNSPGKVEQVAALVRHVVELQPGTRFVQCPLVSLGASALEFEVVYHVANREGVNHSATVDAVNRGIFRAFSEAAIALAYPTQRVLISEVRSSVAGAAADAGEASAALPLQGLALSHPERG